MTEPRAELKAFADTAVIGGTLLVVGGSAAVIWPEPMLVPALVVVGVTCVVAGFYQMSSGFAVRRTERTWPLIASQGALLILFGLLTEGVTALRFFPALAVVAAWMMLCALHSWAAALLAAQRRFTRNALSLWGALHVFGALLLVLFSVGTMLGLLFLGAIYAAVLGAWLVAGGYWLRAVLPKQQPKAAANRQDGEPLRRA